MSTYITSYVAIAGTELLASITATYNMTNVSLPRGSPAVLGAANRTSTATLIYGSLLPMIIVRLFALSLWPHGERTTKERLALFSLSVHPPSSMMLTATRQRVAPSLMSSMTTA